MWCNRGSSHVGVIRSLVEAGIPIDMVGGTSIGSLVGAVWADEPNPTALIRRIREWSMVRSVPAFVWQYDLFIALMEFMCSV